MLKSSKILVVALAAGGPVHLAACGDDGVAPPGGCEDIVCTFTAETFTLTTDGVTTDLLERGSTLTITLREDGTTTGQLFVPDGDEDGSDLDANLDGTYSFDDDADEVTFSQEADTFVRDVTFSVVSSNGRVRLEAERTDGSTTVVVVLS